MRLSALCLTLLIGLTAIFSGCAQRAAPPQPIAQQADNAAEVQQKLHNLAQELLAGTDSAKFAGYVALPQAFINENYPSQAAPLGKMAADAMLDDFTSRGVNVRQYIGASANPANITLVGPNPGRNVKRSAVLVGTYQRTADATFVNARLVNPANGQVINTAETMLPNSPYVASLTQAAIPAAAASGSAYVAPQFAPVRSPTYPTLGGSVIQTGTASIPLVQGR